MRLEFKFLETYKFIYYLIVKILWKHSISVLITMYIMMKNIWLNQENLITFLAGARTRRHEQAAQDQDFPRNVISNIYTHLP